MRPHSTIIPCQSISSYRRKAIASITAQTDIPASSLLYLTALVTLILSEKLYTALSVSSDTVMLSLSQSALYLSVSFSTLSSEAASPCIIVVPASAATSPDSADSPICLGVTICTTCPSKWRSCSPAALLRLPLLYATTDDVPQPPSVPSEPSHSASSTWQCSATYIPACLYR